MVTVKCQACGKFLEIPEEYRGQTGKCNVCGGAIAVPKSNNKPVPAWKMGCLYAFLALMFIGFVGSLLEKGSPASQPVTSDPPVRFSQPASPEPVEAAPAYVPSPAPVASPSKAITLAKFNQIQQGMTYQQVVAILGEEGEVMSENSFGAGEYSVHTILYVWKAGFMANMNCMFQNGSLMSKSQLGLK